MFKTSNLLAILHLHCNLRIVEDFSDGYPIDESTINLHWRKSNLSIRVYFVESILLNSLCGQFITGSKYRGNLIL